MKANSLIALVACSLLASCAEPATGPSVSEDLEPAFRRGTHGPPFTAGEQQPTVDVARGFTHAIFPAGDGQVLAQTFSPPKNRKLGFIELPVGCSADVLLNVKIREGIGGPILYEANVAGLLGPVDGHFELIQVYDPATSNGIKIRKNLTYAFELAAFPADPANPSPTCGLAPGPAGNSYDRGQGFFQDPINGPAFLPLPNGAPSDDEDLPFVILVR